MPDWKLIQNRYEGGELNSAQRTAYEEALFAGRAPRLGETEAGATKRQYTNRAIKSNPQSMSEQEKQALMGGFLETIGENPDGIGYFTSNAEGMTGDQMLKTFQNAVDPGKHKDVMTDLEKWQGMDEEQKAENRPTFTKENALASLENLAAFGWGSGGGEIGKDIANRTSNKAETNRLMRKDFMAMRSFYESVVTSTEGRDYAKTVADTGVWNSTVFNMLPEEEKKLIPGYVQTLKTTGSAGVLEEAAVRFALGVKDITVDTVEYVGEKGFRGAFTAAEMSGFDGAKHLISALDEKLAEDSAEEQALATKFEERNLPGKAFTGIASSLPLMASFFITGPAGSASALKAARLGRGITGGSAWARTALAYNKLVKHYPVAMATLGIAKDHEQLMISQGVDREFAAPAALLTSVVNMYVEKMALDNLLGLDKTKLFKVANNFVLKRLAAKGGNFVVRASQGMGGELLEEEVQSFNEELVTEFGLGKVDAKKLAGTVINTFVESFPTTLGFGIGGAMLGGSKNQELNTIDYINGYTRDDVYKERLSELIPNKPANDAEKRDAFNKVFKEWSSAKDVDAQEAVLTKHGFVDVAKAQTVLEEAQQNRELAVEAERATIAERQAAFEKFQAEELPALQDAARAFAEEAGIDSVAFVEQLSETLDPQAVGQIKNNAVEVLRSFADPKQIVRHEAFHKFLGELNVLDATEKATLTAATPKLLKMLEDAGLKTGTIYAGMEGDAKVEEILADAGAILNEQELTVWQKVQDLFEKLGNLVKGEGFKSVRSMLQDVERRGLEASKQGSTVETTKFAKRQQQEGSFRKLTKAVATRLIIGRKADVDTIRSMMAEGSEFTAQDVLNEASAIAGDVGKEGDVSDKASAASVRLGVRKAADKRYLDRFSKRVFKEGVRAGRVGAEAEQKVKKLKDATEKRTNKKERASAEANKSVEVVQDLAKADVDIAATIQSVADVVKTALGEGVSQNLLDATLQKTLYKVLTKANNTLSNSRTRASVAKKLEAIRTADKIGEADLIKKANAIAQSINESALKQDAVSLRQRIKQTLGRTIKNESKRKEATKRKVDPQLNAWLKAVKVATGLTRADKDAATAGLAKGINEPLADDSAEGKEFRQAILNVFPSLSEFEDLSNEDLGFVALELVGTFGNIKDKGVADLQDALETLNSSIDLGKMKRLVQLREQRKLDTERAERIANGIVSSKTQKLGDKASAFTRMLSSLMGLRSMFKMISSSGSGEANKIAKKQLADILREYNRADQDFRLEEFNAHEVFLTKIADIYNVAVPGFKTLMPNVKDAFGVLTELKKKEDKWKHLSNDKQTALSKLDIMQKYGAAIQEDGSKSVEENNVNVKGLRAALTDADIELMEVYRNYYKEQLPIVNQIMKRIAGVSLDMKDPLYLPIIRVADAGTGIRETHNAMSLFPQYFVDRVNSPREFSEDYDIHDVWLMRMSETAKFKHFVDVNIKLRDVLLHDKTLDAIGRSWGTKVADAWRDKLSLQMLGYVSNDTSAAKGFQQSLNTVRKMWVGSKFFMNMRVGLKQAASVPAFAFEIGLKNTGVYLKDALSPTSGIFIKGSDANIAMNEILNHPLAKERGKLGNSEALRSFLKNTTPSKFKRILQLGRLPNTVGDMVPVALVGQGIYRSKFNELHETGMSEKAAKEEAMSYLFEVVESTQQSGRSKDLADLQLNDSVFNKILFTFKSTVRQYLEKELVDFVALIRAEPDMRGKALADFGRNMALNHIMLPGLYNGMNILLNFILGEAPDEDDAYIMLMSMLLGPSSAVPIIGVMVAGMMDSLATGKFSGYGDMISPFAGAISDGRAVASAVNGLAPWTDRQFVDGIDRLVSSTFAPYREIKKALKDEE